MNDHQIFAALLYVTGAMEETGSARMYGDMVPANMVWNYSNGKYVPITPVVNSSS